MHLDEIIEQVAAIATTIVRSDAKRIDQDALWPRKAIKALQSAGLGGLVIPRQSGGLGQGLLAVARVCETLGRECPSTAISFGMHLVGSAVLAAKPTKEQQRRYLEPIAQGKHLTTLALSEPGTGSHFYIPQTHFESHDEGFVLSGIKCFVTNGGVADSYVISATMAVPNEPGEFSCVIVEAETPGLTWGPPWSGWGMRGNSSRTAKLTRVFLEREALLGRIGDEIWYLFNVVTPYFLIAMAGTYVGLAEAAFEEARVHVRDRSYDHTGMPLSHVSVIQHRLGSLWAAVQRTRAFIYEAARQGERGGFEAIPALFMAKAEVADVAERITAEAMTLLGGRGYAEGHRIHRLYRDARAAHVMAPTTDILRTWAGRSLLELPILGE